jgi:hypothetical protein
VYGRGTIDDKDNLTAGLMTMLMLKRLNVPLDRDVIFLAEAGEEGNSRIGVGYMVAQHFPEIEAEYCLAEGGDIVREHGAAKYAEVETVEKVPRGIELIARGIAGHGSIPLKSNADRAPRRRGRSNRRVASRHQVERNDCDLFPQARDAGTAGTSEVLPRRDLAGSEGGACGRRLALRE